MIVQSNAGEVFYVFMFFILLSEFRILCFFRFWCSRIAIFLYVFVVYFGDCMVWNNGKLEASQIHTRK